MPTQSKWPTLGFSSPLKTDESLLATFNIWQAMFFFNSFHLKNTTLTHTLPIRIEANLAASIEDYRSAVVLHLYTMLIEKPQKMFCGYKTFQSTTIILIFFQI